MFDFIEQIRGIPPPTGPPFDWKWYSHGRLIAQFSEKILKTAVCFAWVKYLSLNLISQVWVGSARLCLDSRGETIIPNIQELMVDKYGGKDTPGNMAVNTHLPTHAL